MTKHESRDDRDRALDDLCEGVLEQHDLPPKLENVVRGVKRGVEDGEIDRY